MQQKPSGTDSTVKIKNNTPSATQTADVYKRQILEALAEKSGEALLRAHYDTALSEDRSPEALRWNELSALYDLYTRDQFTPQDPAPSSPPTRFPLPTVSLSCCRPLRTNQACLTIRLDLC